MCSGTLGIQNFKLSSDVFGISPFFFFFFSQKKTLLAKKKIKIFFKNIVGGCFILLIVCYLFHKIVKTKTLFSLSITILLKNYV